MKRYLFSFIPALIYCFSCNGQGSIVEGNIDILYKNKLGNDLLLPKTKGHFKKEDIHLYRVVYGIEKEYLYNGYIPTHPEGFILVDDSLDKVSAGGAFLRVFFDLSVDTISLHLSPQITDTLVYALNRNRGNILLEKFWYNGNLCWDRKKSNGNRRITILK